MRNIILLFILAFNIESYCQTTLEEYNYITKGYKIQIESGLDMKKGYNLKLLKDFTFLNFGNGVNDGDRGFTFKGLYRELDNKPCAIMAIYERRINGVKQVEEYYCIPSKGSSESLWLKTLDQINNQFNNENAKKIYSAMVWALMKFSSEAISD